jgi:hypothetical protein
MAEAPVRLIWSLSSSGLGTSITTSGNSGSYSAANQVRTAVDLRFIDDLWLSITATGGAGTNATAELDAYDDLGNLFTVSTGTTALLKTPSLASAPGSAVAFGGRHGGGGSGTYLVLPEWGRVSWALTGTMTGVEIALYGRG